MIRRLLTFSVFIGMALPCLADSPAFIGGVFAVELPTGATSAVFNGEPQLIIGRTAVVAIPIDMKLGEHTLTVHLNQNLIQEVAVPVTDKQYPEEHITITDETLVTPPPETLERIRKESEMIRNTYDLRTPALENLVPIAIPVEGRISGVFGSRRFFNEKPRNPHSGIDYAAPTGTPIQSPTSGSIALTGDFYFNGNTVMIDHGSGFISVMCHLDRIDVEVGENVERGEVIGTVGSTGRSTGPHLHWTISLQGTKVDPSVFMDVVNALPIDDATNN